MKKILCILMVASISHFSAHSQCNTTFGSSAGVPTGSSGLNTHIGCSAGQNSTTNVMHNTLLGAHAGHNNTGQDNTFVGTFSGDNNTGIGNTFLGMATGYQNQGDVNTFVGISSGQSNTTGSENSYFGYNSGGAPSIQHSSAIGADAYVCANNTVVLGSSSNNTVIGACAPLTNPFTSNLNKLSIVGGDFMVADGHHITNPTLAPLGTPSIIKSDNTGTLQPLQFSNNTTDYLGGDGNWHSDGLGNHTATQALDMQCNDLDQAGDLLFCNGTVLDQNIPGELILHGGALGIGISPGSVPPNPNPAMLAVAGDIWALSNWYPSDKRFKKNINVLNSALETVKKMNGYNYEYKKEKFPEYNFSNGRTIGFLAQELENISPELVRKGENGYYSVNYTGIIPILAEAIKEQQTIIETHANETAKLEAKIENFESEIAELKAAVKSICNDGCGSLGTPNNPIQTNTFAYSEEIRLEQNAPNPFNSVTTIEYYLPKEVETAALLIYDLQGKQLKKYEITATGKGNVTIDAGDLSGGMYLYSLLVDGKPSSTLKMILTE